MKKIHSMFLFLSLMSQTLSATEDTMQLIFHKIKPSLLVKMSATIRDLAFCYAVFQSNDNEVNDNEVNDKKLLAKIKSERTTA